MGELLQDKVVLITGASSGIGRALAQRLAGHGAKLALTGRSKERLEAVAVTIGNAETEIIPADLARPGQVEKVIEQATARFGPVDILAANAGLYIPGDVADGDPDAWDEMISLNINSVFRAVHLVLPEMIKRRAGHIVITSSIAGHQSIIHEPVYCATKHAVQAFAHAVRRQVTPHNIRVGLIAPGIVLNPLWGYHDEKEIAEKVAANEGIRSEDVADSIAFMLTRPEHVTIRDLVILPQAQDI
ncbi:MAG: SDR family oxidoreductase [Alphaproteobacteria bacterium]|nr:SDR family oxidoreductase [Alphaproteobacteria bacterium]